MKSTIRIAIILVNSLIFRPLYRMVIRFVLRNDSISSILAIPRSGILMKTNTQVAFTAHFKYTKKKKSVSHSIVSDSEV